MTDEHEPVCKDVGEVCVFYLHFVTGGHAYFSTHSLWKGRDEKGREIRCPSLVLADKLDTFLYNLALPAHVINTAEDYQDWLREGGWAVVPKDVARRHMPQWLKMRHCITHSGGSFTDVALAAPEALSRYAHKALRRAVLERHGSFCALCGKSESDGVTLTMHHLHPFSRGGETSEKNLVPLCNHCNNRIGTACWVAGGTLPILLQIDKYFFGDGDTVPGAAINAMVLHGNMMDTRCKPEWRQ